MNNFIRDGQDNKDSYILFPIALLFWYTFPNPAGQYHREYSRSEGQADLYKRNQCIAYAPA